MFRTRNIGGSGYVPFIEGLVIIYRSYYFKQRIMVEKSLYANEINPFDVIDVLLQNKWLIATFSILSFIICSLYLQFSPAQYRVNVSYTVNADTVESAQLCQTYKCLQDQVSVELLDVLDRGWVKRGLANRLHLVTSNPLDVAQYEIALKATEKNLTDAALIKALAELELIDNAHDRALLSTEYFAMNKLNSDRLVALIDVGKSVIEFDKPVVTLISPNVKLLFVVSIILGGVLGSFLVLIRHSYWKHKAVTAGSCCTNNALD